MQLIDTHTHLYLPEFDTDRDDVVQRAIQIGVEKMLMPNIDIHSCDMMISVEKRYPGICYSMIGLHPTSVKDDYLSQLDRLDDQIAEHKFVAIGEIGLDLYWDKTHLEEQLSAFRRQISLSINQKLPLVIHSRDSFPEVFSLLDEFRGEKLSGVLHAFTGTLEDAERAIALGFKLGIGGIVTFKNSGLENVIKNLSPENLILETDSPYLSPVPFRGKRNESSYLCLINKKLAEIFSLSEEDCARITTGNSINLFNL